MKRLHVCILLIGILSSGVAAACAQPVKVRIGVIGPLQGSTEYLGRSHENGIALALSSAPSDSFAIEMISMDDKSDPKTSQEVFDVLVNKENVLAVMGACNSACTFADAKLALKNRIALFTSASAATKITSGDNPYVFRGAITNRYQMKRTVEFLKEDKGFKKFAAFYEVGDEYSEGAKDDFLEGSWHPLRLCCWIECQVSVSFLAVVAQQEQVNA